MSDNTDTNAYTEPCRIDGCEEKFDDRENLIDHLKEAHDVESIEENYDDPTTTKVRAAGLVEAGKPGQVDDVSPDDESDTMSDGDENVSRPDDSEEAPAGQENKESQNDQQFEKWYLLGVGGGGCNVVDAILLRQKTLEEDEHPLASAWKRGVRQVASLNTNVDSELRGTYFAHEYTDGSLADAAAKYQIGPSSEQGAGRVEERGDLLARWDMAGNNTNEDLYELLELDESEFMNADFLQNKGQLVSTDWMEDAQAVMVFHTAVKGTGSGTTPLITRWLRENALERPETGSRFTAGQSIFSGLILPRGDTQDEALRRNGLVGMARMSTVVNAIIPFDNGRLENLDDSIRAEIKGTKGYNLAEYNDANETMVAWMEGATLASIPETEKSEFKIGRGDFDVKDMYDPATDMRPRVDGDISSAVIIAPTYGQVALSHNREFDMSALQELLTETVHGGKMIDFEETSAWGGSFVVIRPKEYENEIRDFETHFEKLLRGEDYMNVNNDKVPAPIEVTQVTVPEIDSVRMWGGFWNPEMEQLRDWYEWGKERKGSRLGTYARLNDHWEEIENLFEFMGRESLKEFV